MTLADPSAAASTSVVVVRRMTAADDAFAAQLHAHALPHGFFGRLGVAFLSAYYETFRASPHAMAFVAVTEAGPAGVLVGTFGPHGSWVVSRRWRTLARRGAAALLSRPAELALFLRTRVGWYLRGLLRRRRSAALPAAGRRTTPPAVLMHVAVHDIARGLGGGAALVDAFVEEARRRGAREACLVTLSGPQGAGAFYERLGWERYDVREDRDGRSQDCYRRRL